MLSGQPLDIIPIYLVFPVTVLLGLLAAEIGFRVGLWMQKRSGRQKDPALGAMVGASLGLLAFLLAFLVGSAGDRFNTRRTLVIEDANAIGTTELRARYLPEPYRTTSRNLLKEYVDVRVNATRGFNLGASIARAEQIQADLWNSVETMVGAQGDSETLALYIDALNHMIDVHGERVAAVYSRVPPTVLFVVYIIAVLSLGLVGYSNSADGNRSWIALIALVLIFSAVITLIVDLDRPSEGFLVVSQQPMLDLQKQLSR